MMVTVIIADVEEVLGHLHEAYKNGDIPDVKTDEDWQNLVEYQMALAQQRSRAFQQPWFIDLLIERSASASGIVAALSMQILFVLTKHGNSLYLPQLIPILSIRIHVYIGC
jgi:hypothetical protein